MTDKLTPEQILAYAAQLGNTVAGLCRHRPGNDSEGKGEGYRG